MLVDGRCEGIAPSRVVAAAASPFQVRALPQDCPQATPYPAIQFPECPSVAVFEVSKPSSRNPIDPHDGLIQTLTILADFRLYFADTTQIYLWNQA